MLISDLCNKRIINKSIITPILIPSFSSTFFGIAKKSKKNEIGVLYNFLKEKLTYAYLISIYDLYYSHIDKNNIEYSTINVFDSGGYEYERYKDAGNEASWNLTKYHSTLDELKPKNKCILVNFDEYGKLKEQMDAALNTFQSYPMYISDFLMKPYKKNELLNIGEVISNITNFNFDILGVREIDLGYSLLDRCKNIVKLRSELIKHDIDIPIHIFGCFDFFNIFILYVCGADIFDGLSWLRYSLYKNIMIYSRNYGLIEGLWKFNDSELFNISYIDNLKKISEFKNKMLDFQTNYDLNIFNFNSDFLNQIKLLLISSGVETRF